MEYTVTITETLARAVVVLADNKEDAEKAVRKMYSEADIVLDSGDFERTEFETVESNSGTKADLDIRAGEEA